MGRIIGIALLVIGVILLIWGANAADSFSSDIKEFFTGNPTDKAMWLFVGGAVAAVVGLGLLVRGRPRHT